MMASVTKCVLAHDHNAMRWVRFKKIDPYCCVARSLQTRFAAAAIQSVSSPDYSKPVATLHYIYKENKPKK